MPFVAVVLNSRSFTVSSSESAVIVLFCALRHCSSNAEYSFAVIALFIVMPVKCSVCCSASAVKSVTTSPEHSTLLPTTPSDSVTARHRSFSNSLIKNYALSEKRGFAGVKPALRKNECSFIIRPKNRCSSNDFITYRFVFIIPPDHRQICLQ